MSSRKRAENPFQYSPGIQQMCCRQFDARERIITIIQIEENSLLFQCVFPFILRLGLVKNKTFRILILENRGAKI